MKRLLLALLFLLVACSSDAHYVVVDRYWEWTRSANRMEEYTTYSSHKIGQTTIYVPEHHTRVAVVCQGRTKGSELPPFRPDLSCRGEFYSDDIVYHATIKTDGGKERKVEFGEEMWDYMEGKVCLRVTLGYANRCKDELASR